MKIGSEFPNGSDRIHNLKNECDALEAHLLALGESVGSIKLPDTGHVVSLPNESTYIVRHMDLVSRLAKHGVEYIDLDTLRSAFTARAFKSSQPQSN